MDEANEVYTRACQWLEQKLSQHDELRRLQQEAAALLEAVGSEIDGGPSDGAFNS